MSNYILFVYTEEFVELFLAKKHNLSFLNDFDIKIREDIEDYISDRRKKIVVVTLSEEIYSRDFRLPVIKDFSKADLLVVYSREDVFKDIETIKKEMSDSYLNSKICVLAGGIDYRTYSDEYFFPLLTQFKLTIESSREDQFKQIVSKKFLFDCLLGTPKPSRKYIYYRLLEDNLLDKSLVSIIRNQDYYLTDHYDDLWPDITSEFRDKYGDVPVYKSEFLDEIDRDFYFENSQRIEIEKPNNSLFDAIKDIINDTDYGHPYWKRIYVTPYKIYHNSWYSIISETYQEHRFHPTEKTAKALLGKRIFVAFCCHDFLKNLKSLGFKTFDTIIDESYDSIKDTKDRFNAAWEQVRYLSVSNHEQNYQKVNNILDHNRSIISDPYFQMKDIEDYILKNAKNL